MPGHQHQTNKALLFLVVVLCLLIGGTFRSSSASMTSQANPGMEDMYVAQNEEEPLPEAGTEEAVPTPTPTPLPSPTPTQAPQPEAPAPSAEAADGVWTPNGSSWYFMVDGSALTGWLTDTDGRRYYFDANGIMQTGWLEDQGIRYYFNGDGVMQTGKAVIDGQLYHFRQDGALEGEPVSPETESGELLFYAGQKTPAPTDAPPEETPVDEAAAEPVSSDEATAEPAASDEAAAEPIASDEATAEPAASDEAAAEPTSSDEAAAEPAASDIAATEPTASNGEGGGKKIALTFDDGPSDFTDRLLDCLEANNAKATFFLVGMEVESFPEPVKRMEALGCEIGNHSYDHPELTSLSQEGIQEQLGRTNQLIQELTGHEATVIRPPYGSVNDSVSATVTLPMILWTVDPEDWNEGEDVDRIVQTVMDQVQEGSVILMHDIFRSSVDAAEQLIPRLIAEGYELVTIHELAASTGTELTPGQLYSSFSPA